MNKPITFSSAPDLLARQLPEPDFLLGSIFRRNSRLTVIGEAKAGKSYFTMHLALAIALGQPFLGMETKKGNVLYVNLEISEEMFQTRMEDLCAAMGASPPENLHIAHVARRLPLDIPAGRLELEQIIGTFMKKHGTLDLLVIDPRSQTMHGDESDFRHMITWTENIYSLMQERKFAVLIVHHTGKNTTGMGRGSSVFDGWVETALWLGDPKDRTRAIKIISRDSDESLLYAQFDYPLWKLTPQEADNRKSKVAHATVAIRTYMEEERDVRLVELRQHIFSQGVRDWAFKRAKQLLSDEGVIESYQDNNSVGNHKRVRWCGS